MRTSAQGGEGLSVVRDAFDQNGRSLGYAFLLKRHVDDSLLATAEHIQRAAWDLVPPLGWLFWMFRLMAGLGFYFILLFAVFFWLASRQRLDRHRWLLWAAVWSIPLPWIAAEAGWFVAEVGRQP